MEQSLVKQAACSHWSKGTYKEEAESAYQKQECVAITLMARKVSVRSFEAGAEWHAKQSPWISVEERLPETNDGQSLYEAIVVTSDRRFLVVINTEVEHLVGLLGVTHWMPIPELKKIVE